MKFQLWDEAIKNSLEKRAADKAANGGEEPNGAYGTGTSRVERIRQIPTEQRDAVAYGQGEESSTERQEHNEEYLKGFENELKRGYVEMPNGSIFFEPLPTGTTMNRTFYINAVHGLLENSDYDGDVRVNGDLSLLLRNKQTGELKFWYPGQQSTIISNQILNLRKARDTENLVNTLCDVDVSEKVYNYAPNSDWEVECILGLRLIVTYL